MLTEFLAHSLTFKSLAGLRKIDVIVYCSGLALGKGARIHYKRERLPFGTQVLRVRPWTPSEVGGVSPRSVV